ncbi:hypothetical protein BJ508DRAFT_335351 [Ascobolus immersus RN42]|uniref:Uncharacterized protein n=1 Tax=Ascobolus immersus RN42 TaxID=1160509 RepID=A0A3N4HCQ7_ASCIM|nr:hypothetical protein BJ508DRAFT_335351 [Ascobolus immersus RN42]
MPTREELLDLSITLRPPTGPGDPDDFNNPNVLPKIIGDRDSVYMVRVKKEFNYCLMFSKQCANNTKSVREIRIRFILLFNPETGGRPGGAPRTYEEVINMTVRQWYVLGEGIVKFKHWRKYRFTLGQCRLEWCAWHSVARMLTMNDIRNPDRAPVGGWLRYPCPAPPQNPPLQN